MSASRTGLRAFGGGPLIGDQWVRVLYLDESEIGNIKRDPIVVVAGVLIHADTQWAAIADELRSLLLDATPFGAKTPAFLHATDIFHGSGDFPRDVWDKDRRHGLLDKVGGIVAKYDVPVVWSALDRKKYAREHPNDNAAAHLRDSYTVCAVSCFMQTEMYMRSLPNQAEVASIVMEQNAELQKRIPEMMEFGRNPVEEQDGEKLLPEWKDVLPFQKLIDTPACQPKTSSSILQLADYCAFSIKRRLQKDGYSRRLTSPLAPQFLMYRTVTLNSKERFWNPKFMPKAWNCTVEFRDGRFVEIEAPKPDQ